MPLFAHSHTAFWCVVVVFFLLYFCCFVEFFFLLDLTSFKRCDFVLNALNLFFFSRFNRHSVALALLQCYELSLISVSWICVLFTRNSFALFFTSYDSQLIISGFFFSVRFTQIFYAYEVNLFTNEMIISPSNHNTVNSGCAKKKRPKTTNRLPLNYTSKHWILFFVIWFVIFILIFGVSNCENTKTNIFFSFALDRFAVDVLSLFRCCAHTTRCLLFENRSVTKQFVVSHKVDKFQMWHGCCSLLCTISTVAQLMRRLSLCVCGFVHTQTQRLRLCAMAVSLCWHGVYTNRLDHTRFHSRNSWCIHATTDHMKHRCLVVCLWLPLCCCDCLMVLVMPAIHFAYAQHDDDTETA